jgi:hypothetical protein
LGGCQRSPIDDVPTGMLRPIKLTYPLLKKVCLMTHTQIVKREWSSATATSFLSAHCINASLSKEIISHADNRLQYDQAMENETEEATRALFSAEKRKRPPLPPFFDSSMDLDQFVDPPLHLLALGVERTSIRVTDVWMGKRGRKLDFLHMVRPMLYHIQSLDLDWCELVPKTFGGSYGGYISDNFTALTRISPWLYLPILLFPPPEPYVVPSTDVQKWTAKDCKHFLAERGLKVPRLVAEKRAAVIVEMGKPLEEQSPILDTPVCTAEEVYQCMVRLFILVSLLFHDQTNGIGTCVWLKVAIRLYLSSFDRLDLATCLSRVADPRWLQSYNFMCLLNIPDTVMKYGPYRNLYEGKFCGEGFNRILKPTAIRSSHRNRSLNLLRNLHQQKAMGAVQHHYEQMELVDQNSAGDSSCDEGSNKKEIYRMAHRYQNRRKVLSHFHNNLPLSAIVYRMPDAADVLGYAVCYVFKASLYLQELRPVEGSEVVIGGAVRFHQWQLVDRSPHSFALDSVVVADYALLLPMICDPQRAGQQLPPYFYMICTYLWNRENSVKYI